MDWLRSFSRQRLNSDLADDRRCISPFAVLELSRHGLLGLSRSCGMGGAGLMPGDSLRVLRQLSAIDLSLALLTGLHNFLSSTPILEHASPSLKSAWSRDLITGSRLASFALTEEGAGSDPRRMAATAEEQEDGTWKIDGHKIWLGAAAWAGIALVFAQARTKEGDSRGITAFAVPLDDPQVIHGPEARTMGLKAVVQSELFFRGVTVPADHLVGALGGGLAVAQSAMMRCRLVCSVFAAGAMMRCLQAVWRYAERRTISSGSMEQNPVVLAKLEEESLRTHSLNLFLERCFNLLDEGREPGPVVYLASKIVGPEMAWLTVDACLQLLGGRGYMEPNVVSRMERDVRVLRIFEGPTEALASHLGSLLGAKPQDVESCLVADLDSPDIWEALQGVSRMASSKTARAEGLSRDQLQSRQGRAGLAAAYGVYFAVVRRQAGPSEEDQAALAWTEGLFNQVLAAAEGEDWVPSPALAQLKSRWEDMVGDVDETKAGDGWDQDRLLRGPLA
jgi:alkylation response protein AidB-like acyl-CoA dehydrogenase